jgi:hypothetical protein
MGKVGVKLAVFFALIGDAASAIATAATVTQCEVQLSIPAQALSDSAGQTIALKGWGPDTAQAQDHAEQVAARIAWQEILLRTWSDFNSPEIRTVTALMMPSGSEHGVPGYRIQEKGCKTVTFSASTAEPGAFQQALWGWQVLWEDGNPDSVIRSSLHAALSASRRRACQAEFREDSTDLVIGYDSRHGVPAGLLAGLVIDNLVGCYTRGEPQLGRVKGPTIEITDSTYSCVSSQESPAGLSGFGRAWGPGLDWTAELAVSDSVLSQIRIGLADIMHAVDMRDAAPGFATGIFNNGISTGLGNRDFRIDPEEPVADRTERAATKCTRLTSNAQALRFSFNAIPDGEWWARSASEAYTLTCSQLEEGASWARQKRRACGETFSSGQQMLRRLAAGYSSRSAAEGMQAAGLAIALMGGVGCDAGLVPSTSIEACPDLEGLLKANSKEARNSLLSSITSQAINNLDRDGEKAVIRAYIEQNASPVDSEPVALSSGNWGVPALVDSNPNRKCAFEEYNEAAD